jgi:hypothetical protein
MKSLRQIIERVRVNREEALALATLVETRGSMCDEVVNEVLFGGR